MLASEGPFRRTWLVSPMSPPQGLRCVGRNDGMWGEGSIGLSLAVFGIA
jgi:hypothetical protein